ncbi:hypothetical protein M427DRAFT_182713 [Gonapodya prolifera JEL478]|uniref:TPR-like protein n=1 Tax=Gonapodya prolifera (strain JEL478) TaxID=1344416 RepID=A0A139A0R4_GONPJ|nr:hypothetical protein M427DRAFT_182713 [Gonapodya prolifera JEL478]|eukprot:KXS10332.1 hypothetical protein M427DRAFT_182713 [Gonapodya prolifera JEL478]
MPKAVFAIGRDRQPLPVPRSMVDRSTLVNIPKSTRSVIAKAEAAEVGGRYADAYASYFEVGELMLDTADYARAKKNLLKALDMAKKMKSLRHQTEANLHLSEAFRGMQKYVPALKHAQAARELAQRSRDFRKIAESWLKEGVVLLNHAEALQEDEGSASYYKSAITAFKEVLSLISSFEANVRDLYELDAEINIGICQKGLENFDEAETAFLRCIIMAKRLGKNEHVRLSQVSENMGILYLEHGKPLDALKNFQVAFDNVGLNDTESQASLKMNIAYCQRNLNKIDEALKSAKESREIAERSHLEESIELAQRFITEIETILTQDRELKRMEEELLRPGGAVNAHQALENRIRAAEMNMKADRPDKAVGHLKVAAGMIRKSKSPPPEEVHNWARVQAFLGECCFL